MNSDDIIDVCEDAFPGAPHACNLYIMAVCDQCFKRQPFSSDMNADRIIEFMENSARWKNLAGDRDAAVEDAQKGAVVIAGMTSEDLDSEHGHLAVVVGDDAIDEVPIGYAKSIRYKDTPPSIKGATEVRREKLSKTFPATAVREDKVKYFSCLPDREPASQS